MYFLIELLNLNVVLIANNLYKKINLFGFRIVFNIFQLDRNIIEPDLYYTSLDGYSRKYSYDNAYGGQLVDDEANGKGFKLINFNY